MTETIVSINELAETIHQARWPADRQMAITPFADEDRNGREYCFRIARSVADFIARATPPSRSDAGSGEVVWLREVDAGTDNACWVISNRVDPTAVPFFMGIDASTRRTTRREALRNQIEDLLCEGNCKNPGMCNGTETTWCGRKADAILAISRPDQGTVAASSANRASPFKPGDKVSTGHVLKKRLKKSPHPDCVVNNTDCRAWEYEGGGWDYEETFALPSTLRETPHG